MSNNELAPISPGQYRTRCGIVAIVSDSDDKLHPPFYWAGTAAGDVEVWDRHGRYYGNSQDSPLDLVARLPDEPPADDRIERALNVLREGLAALQPEPQPQPTDDRMRRALQLIAQLADTGSRAHKERFCPNGEGDGIANGWRVAEAMREIANDVVGNNRIESTQTVSPNAATRPTSDEFHAAVMAYMPWIAERIPQHRRVIEAVRLCAKSPEQAACGIEVAWMDGGVEPQPPADDRIERALQVLREGLAALQPGDAYLYADYARQAVQILESTP